MELFGVEIKDIYYLFAIIGIPVGICVFLWEKHKERAEREIDIYLQSCDRYIDYLNNTLAHPDLKCGEFRGDEQSLLTSGLSVQQITMYSILMMVMERTYFLYHRSRITGRNEYWTIWGEYIKWWATREDFQKAWRVIDPWLNPKLTELIENEIRKKDSTPNK
jgi:hypothetical protein